MLFIRKKTFFISFIPSIALFCSGTPDKDNTPWELKNYTVQADWNADDLKAPIALAPIPKNIPNSYTMPNLPKVGDQGAQASGTAWATGYFATSYIYQKKSRKKKYICSPAFVYNSLNQGLDQGIEIYNALELLKNRGCASEKLMPYNSEDPAHQAGSRALKEASKYKISNFARVEYSDLDQIRSYLLQNKPIVATIQISDNFIQLREKLWEKPIGKFRGKHTMALIGYNDKKRTFLFLNSVGTKWGAKGFVSIPYSWFIRLCKKVYVIW